MRKEKSNVKKVVLIIVLCLFIAIGAFCAIYFILKKDDIKYYDVKLNSSANKLELSLKKMSLSPNDDILARPVRVGLDSTSESSFIRAKVVFESDSNDSRVLSFVSQLNFAVKDLTCYQNDEYNWTYYKDDNAFYLTLNSENLKVAQKNNNYVFLENLIVPNTLKQMETLNSDGENVQIGEDVELRITFEAIQTNLFQDQSDVQTMSNYFNISACQYENGYYCQNGFITCCTRQEDVLILPKYVGNDYVLGIDENAFENTGIKKIIVPANYIYFNENAFSSISNLEFVAIKNDINITLYASTFRQNGITEIYLTKSMLNYTKQNLSTLPYISNLKSMTEIYSDDIENIDTSSSYIYSSLANLNIDLSLFQNLKVADFPALENVSDNMFSELKNLVLVECPNAKIVGSGAFFECSNLISVVLDKNIQQVGENCFYGCSSLKEAVFTKSLKTVSSQAFKFCTNLTDVRFENEEVEIKFGAFSGCDNLRTAYFESLSSVEDEAFVDCSSLRWFIVKNSSNLNISGKAFSSTEGSKNSNLIAVFSLKATKDDFITKNPQFENQFVLVDISNGELKSFEGNIRNIDLNDFNKIEKITKIGDNAFKDNTYLSSIVLPYSIQSIGNKVFDGAKSLNKITFNGFNVPTAVAESFEGLNGVAQIFVPKQVLQVYKQTYKDFNLNILSD